MNLKYILMTVTDLAVELLCSEVCARDWSQERGGQEGHDCEHAEQFHKRKRFC
jgi:hypothetical protein